MVKNPRKRQKTGKIKYEQVPLGTKTALLDDASKDDEERRLESLLFGVPYAPEKAEKEILVVSDEEADDGQLEAGREFENLLDSDLFFVDDNAGPTSELNNHAPRGYLQSQSNAEDENDQNFINSEVPESAEDEEIPAHKGISQQLKKPKAPAWTDTDDVNVQVSLASSNRLRKLRDAPSDDTVGGREYERRLRRQFERINPAPDWASNARKKSDRAKRRRRTSASGSDSGEDVIPDLLASTAGIKGTANPRHIPPTTLSIERLRDANQSAPADGAVRAVAFHPSPHIPVLLTASADRRLRLFHIDGLTNPHAQTLHIPSLPISNAVFHPSGTSILMTGPRPFYYTYDLQSGASHRSPRGLWGTTFSSGRSEQGTNIDLCSFNPTGDILAVAGRRGQVHLVDWRSGAAQVVGGLKANANIKSLWWSTTTTTTGGAPAGDLLGLTEDSQVYVWNIGQRKCVKRWQDEGGFGSRLIGGDGHGKYLTIGSNTGLLNVYNAESTVDLQQVKPKTLKTIGNLTTSISTLRFNHDSQLLAMASDVKKDQMRLVHCPSLTVFANWPTSSTPLGHVTSIDFSRESEYLAVGNNRGRVLLYQLRHFAPH